MANFTKIKPINLPDINVVYKSGGYNFGEQTEKNNNLQMLIDIKRLYGASIKKWSGAFELPERVLTSFIAVESNGKMVGKNSAGAIGLTQVTTTAIIEAVSKFKTITGSDLPNIVETTIKSKAKYLLDLTPNSQDLSSANTKKLESLLQSDADFNIMMGALVLRWNLDFTKANGYVHLNKAIMAYNQSAYGRIGIYKNRDITTLTLLKDKAFPSETRDYLVKVLGVNGYLHLYNKNNV